MIGEQLAKCQALPQSKARCNRGLRPASKCSGEAMGVAPPGRLIMLKKTLKKIGLPILALAGMMMFLGTPKANAAVRFGVGIGVPYAYSYPYPYAYGYPGYYPYAYPYAYGYGYPYYGGFYGGYWGGWG